MSVERALQNVDILSAICEELAPERSTKAYTGRQSRRRDLASLARVSHTFSDTAVRVLWRVLLGIGPVLRLIPNVAATDHNIPRSWAKVTHFTLTYRDNVDGWQAKFEKYTRHVRVIDHTNSYGAGTLSHLRSIKLCERFEYVNPILEQYLLLAFRDTPLLPLLHRLTWPRIRVAFQSAPPLILLRPSLQRLTLQLETLDEEQSRSLESLLSAVASLAPGLEELTLYQARPRRNLFRDAPQQLQRPLHLPEVALQAIAKCTRLQRFSAKCYRLILRQQFLIMLSALSQLRHLCVIASDLQVGGMPGTIQRMPAVLETLELTTQGEAFAEVVKHVQASKLRKLSLRCCDEFISRDRWAIYLRRLPLDKWSSTICIVHLWLNSVTASPSETLTQWIQPLVALQSLERLEICIRENTAPDLFDDDALFISQSWPRLIAFLLLYEAPTCKLSHQSLQYFAENCPSLEELVLPGICDPDVDHHAHLTRPRPQDRLKTLLFGPYVHVRCMKCFARYVHTMFPNIHAYGSAADHVRFPYHKRHCRDFWKALCAESPSY